MNSQLKEDYLELYFLERDTPVVANSLGKDNLNVIPYDDGISKCIIKAGEYNKIKKSCNKGDIVVGKIFKGMTTIPQTQTPYFLNMYIEIPPSLYCPDTLFFTPQPKEEVKSRGRKTVDERRKDVLRLEYDGRLISVFKIYDAVMKNLGCFVISPLVLRYNPKRAERLSKKFFKDVSSTAYA